MKHRFNLWNDFLLKIVEKIVGKEYGCCDKLRNCHKCCVKNGYESVALRTAKEMVRKRGNK